MNIKTNTMNRTNIKPLLPHEVDFVVNEFKGIKWNPSSVRIFINERIVVHSFKPDYRGYYFLLDPNRTAVADVMDLGDVLDACLIQVQNERRMQPVCSALYDRLHNETSNFEPIFDKYSNQDFLEIYGEDGSWNSIRIKAGVDGVDGPSLDIALELDGVDKLLRQLIKVKRAIEINNEINED